MKFSVNQLWHMKPSKYTIKADCLSWWGEMGTGRRRINVNEIIWALNGKAECEKVLARTRAQILVWHCWVPGCYWSHVLETEVSPVLWGVNGNVCKMPLWEVQHRSLRGTHKTLDFIAKHWPERGTCREREDSPTWRKIFQIHPW